MYIHYGCFKITCWFYLPVLFQVICEISSEANYLDGIDYLGIGFDIIDDDPDHLNDGRKIIELEYTKNQITADKKALLPDNVDRLPGNTCSFEMSTTTISGMTSYQNTLMVRVKEGADIPSYKLAFTGSQSYQKTKSNIFSTNKVTVDSVSSCVNYIAQFRSQDYVSVTADFMKDVLNLPLYADEKKYLAFTKLYGTHYISKVWMGSLETVHQVFEESIWKEMVSTSIDVSLVAKIGWSKFVGGNIEVGFGSDEKTMYECVNKSAQFICEYKGVPSPTEKEICKWIQPNGVGLYPINFELKEIWSLIDQKYIRYVTWFDLNSRQTLMKNYLKSYCGSNTNCNLPLPDREFSTKLPTYYKYKCRNNSTATNIFIFSKPILNFLAYCAIIGMIRKVILN